jgi:hypothetical protein
LEQPIKVPADALEVFLSVHFIFVVQDEDGLGVGVRGVPELERRPTPRYLRLCPRYHQRGDVRP